MKNAEFFIRIAITLILSFYCLHATPAGTQKKKSFSYIPVRNRKTILYGQASFYAPKFQGRQTANGEKFSHTKYTAACNSLPLGTWVRVTNLKNGKTLVVKTNDRLHPSTRRLIDLSKSGAQKLGFVKSGLTRVKVEVLRNKDG